MLVVLLQKVWGHCQCRVISETGAPISDADLLELLKRISLLAKWVHRAFTRNGWETSIY